MLEFFKPTKKEREAIERGFYRLAEINGHSNRAERFAKEEARGYGNTRDRVPLIAARGMLCKWFLQGVAKPDALLRDNYFSRPAAVWARGFGADAVATNTKTLDVTGIQLAAEAYETAFNRMTDTYVDAFNKSAKALVKVEA